MSRTCSCWFLILLVAAGVVGALTGCGEEEQGTASQSSLPCQNIRETTSEYVTVLCEYHDAVAREKTFDVYGYAEYMPPSQRAAIDAFCLVVDEGPGNLEERAAADPAYFTEEIVATAKAEIEFGSAANLRKAVTQLRSILGVESFDQEIVEHYANACYD